MFRVNLCAFCFPRNIVIVLNFRVQSDNVQEPVSGQHVCAVPTLGVFDSVRTEHRDSCQARADRCRQGTRPSVWQVHPWLPKTLQVCASWNKVCHFICVCCWTPLKGCAFQTLWFGDVQTPASNERTFKMEPFQNQKRGIFASKFPIEHAPSTPAKSIQTNCDWWQWRKDIPAFRAVSVGNNFHVWKAVSNSRGLLLLFFCSSHVPTGLRSLSSKNQSNVSTHGSVTSVHTVAQEDSDAGSLTSSCIGTVKPCHCSISWSRSLRCWCWLQNPFFHSNPFVSGFLLLKYFWKKQFLAWPCTRYFRVGRTSSQWTSSLGGLCLSCSSNQASDGVCHVKVTVLEQTPNLQISRLTILGLARLIRLARFKKFQCWTGWKSYKTSSVKWAFVRRNKWCLPIGWRHLFTSANRGKQCYTCAKSRWLFTQKYHAYEFIWWHFLFCVWDHVCVEVQWQRDVRFEILNVEMKLPNCW